MKTTITVVLAIIALPFLADAQTLVSGVKSKFYGTYYGQIPSYKVLADTNQIAVSKVDVLLKLSANAVVKQVGRLEQKGTYKVLFKDKKYYVIEISFPENSLIEKWMLKEKPKELLREGIMNQPAINLKKR